MNEPASSGDALPDAGSILAMLPLLDLSSVAEIEHALSLRLTPAPTPAERRWAQLGVLATLLNAFTEPGGRVPSLARHAYEQHRERHAPKAPDHRTLVELYGSWVKACKAAHGLLPDGRYLGKGKPWPSPLLNRQRVPSYSLEELHGAIERCAAELGRVPSSGDYHRWSIEKKRHARRTGAKLRIPDIKVLYRLYTEGANRWQCAVAGARLNEVVIAQARAKKLLGAIGVPERPDAPLARLHLLTDEELANAGLAAETRPQVQRAGFGWLPLRQAITLANLLDGSLDWIAGRSLDAGDPPADTATFSADHLKHSLATSNVTPKALREQLELPVGPYRDLVTGKRDAVVAELVVIAAALNCRLDDLLDDLLDGVACSTE